MIFSRAGSLLCVVNVGLEVGALPAATAWASARLSHDAVPSDVSESATCCFSVYFFFNVSISMVFLLVIAEVKFCKDFFSKKFFSWI